MVTAKIAECKFTHRNEKNAGKNTGKNTGKNKGKYTEKNHTD